MCMIEQIKSILPFLFFPQESALSWYKTVYAWKQPRTKVFALVAIEAVSHVFYFKCKFLVLEFCSVFHSVKFSLFIAQYIYMSASSFG